MEQLLTVKQAAERLQLGETKTWALIASGQLKSCVIGRSRRVPSSAIDDFIARLMQQGQEGAA